MSKLSDKLKSQSEEFVKKITSELPDSIKEIEKEMHEAAFKIPDMEQLEKDMRNSLLKSFSDSELVNELRSRGYEVKCTKSIEL